MQDDSSAIPTALDEAARSATLDAEIQRYVADGYRLTVRTATTAQLVKPKRWSWGWALVWLVIGVLTIGLGLVAYIVWFLLIARDKTVYLSVDISGRVTATKG